jgi:non-heme Fe2+,alpha-ketoglutarate-dependent halogenase
VRIADARTNIEALRAAGETASSMQQYRWAGLSEVKLGNSLDSTLVEHYRRRGYVFPVPALTSAEAAGIRAVIEDFEQYSGLAAGHVIRNKGHLKLTRLYELIFHPQVLDAVESVLGPDILCWGSSLFVKEAHDPGFVAWHQDAYYWGLEPDDVVSAWIALYPSTIQNGAMRVIPGSQAMPPLSHRKSAADSPNMLFTHEELAEDVDESKAVDITLAQGDMSLHHVKILHGSPPNHSSGRRMGYAIRYVAPHVKQRGDMNTATLVHGEDRYGYFAKDPVPIRDMDPDIVAFVDRPYGGKPAGALVTDARPSRSA